jgi:hypothetical protein
MSRLLQRFHLHCPYQRARTYLQESLQIFASTGQPQVVKLHVPITIGENAGIDKDVIFTFGEGVDPLHFDQPWTVHWTPQGDGPYPDFEGTLTVRANDDLRSSVLELQGAYEPALGVGAAFDAIVGSRLASATAREFLRTVARELERRYDADRAGNN